MKKNLNILVRIFAIGSALSLLIVLLINVDDASKLNKHEDIQSYIDDNYEQLFKGNTYKATAEQSKLYIPKYSELLYNKYVSSFYIFDGSATIIESYVSFVLELKFDSLNIYNDFIDYEHIRHKYSGFDITYNDYYCRSTYDENISYFGYKQTLPYMTGIFCVNREKLIVRYIYFNSFDSHNIRDLNEYFIYTNCEW